MNSEVIDKLDVVHKQLEEVILLLFEKRDKVVIHTIIASAHQILMDIGINSETISAMKTTNYLSKKETQTLLKTINYPYNFFKHADKDPSAKINVEPLYRFTQDFIMDAIVLFQNINGSIPASAKIYWAWFVSFYPEEFDNLPITSEIRHMKKLKMNELTFSEIIQFMTFSKIMEANKT